jgi:acetylornithine/N-succinyldiaminopimelate aminotransferase
MSTDVSALMRITDRPPVVMVEGHGSWLRDEDGKTYLDFVQGWAVNCLGHSPAVIAETIAFQARRLINCSPAYYNAEMAQLATRLAVASGLAQVFFCNSGAEANEGAIKLARKWGARYREGAHEIITMDHGFHGRTLATMAASGKAAWEPLFEPKVPGFIKVTLGDLEAVKRAITPRTVAVMLEPIQGEAGVYPAGDEFLQARRAVTTEAGLLLILDEIQTGIGRTGRFLAYEHARIEPDILTLGKGLGGGVPLAALVAAEAVCCFEPGDQGGTFNGSPLMTAIGNAVVEAVSSPAFLADVVAKGDYLTQRLLDLSARLGHGEVRGRGLLLALELRGTDAGKLSRTAMDRGLLLNAPRPDALRFMPALNVRGVEIDRMLVLLEWVRRESSRAPGGPGGAAAAGGGEWGAG